MTDQTNGTEQHSEFISLTAGGQGFCVDIHAIREIRSWTPVTTLPFAEDAVLGVMNLRGAVIPIVDLKDRLGLGMTSADHRNVIVIVSLSGRTLGLLVEAVSEIISVSADEILPNPTPSAEGHPAQITGLISRDEQMLRVLDLSCLAVAQTEDAA